MALTTEDYGPTERMPQSATGEWQRAHLIGDGTSVAVAAGSGEFNAVHNNVPIAGSASFHDAVSGATLNAANRLLFIDTLAQGLKTNYNRYSFRQGLQIVTTAALCDIVFQLSGRPTVSPRTFGA